MKLRTSSSIIGFREKAEKIWKLERYRFPQDIFKPVVFFGCYHIGDYFHYFVNRGKKTIVWAGSDILALKRSKIPWHLLFKNAKHYCENEVEQKGLASKGISAEIKPSFLEDVNDFPVCFKPAERPQVFLSGHPEREREYGFGLVLELAHRLPDIDFHIYGVKWTNELIMPYIDSVDINTWVKYKEKRVKLKNVIYHGRVSPEQFNEEIRNYHCGLRLNKHDGFSEIIAKSVLMGQYPISRIKYPYIDNYETEEELITLLKELKNKKEPNLSTRQFWQIIVNNYPWMEVMEIIGTKPEGYLKYNLVKKGSADSCSKFRQWGFGEEFIELVSIHIYPKFRRQGHGTNFINELVEIAKLEKVPTILLTGHTEGNDVFGKFLLKTGFYIKKRLNEKDIVFAKDIYDFTK